MPGEIRRSGRATKGQHTKNNDLDTSPPKKGKKTKGKSAKQASSEPEDDEGDDSIIRCVCGATEDEGGLMMICCEKCSAWQHNLCMAVTELDNELENITYYCEQCKPADHKELLAAMAKGLKPWEDRINKRKEEEKQSKKGKKGGKKGGRSSTAHDAEPVSTPRATSAAQSPVATIETGTKRKYESLGSSTNGQHSSATPAAGSTTRNASTTTPNQEHTSKRTKSVSEASRRTSVPSTPKIESIDKLTKERQPPAQALSTGLKTGIQKAVKTGSYSLPSGYSIESISVQFALEIEHAIHVKYSGNTTSYGEQFRAILFNIKKNETLLLRVLSGAIPTEVLADMTSDQMASEEQQKERAAIKEEADKQAILLHDEGPRYRKTHKGEELISDEPTTKVAEEPRAAPVRRRTVDETPTNVPVDTGSPPPDTELPEGYDQIAAPGDALSPTASANQFNVQQVWKGVQPTTSAFQLDRSQTGSAKQASSIDDDPELTRLFKDEMDVDPKSSVPGVKWVGSINMNSVGGFKASAQFGCGYDIGVHFPYTELLAPALDIDGRISTTTADKYVSDMRFSQSNEVCGLLLSPVDEDTNRKGFEVVYNYFMDKDRWGVIAARQHEAVRDMYLVPIPAGNGPLPNFVNLLTQSEIPPARPTNLLLLTLVVRTKSQGTPIPIQQGNTPMHPQTPVNQLQPSFSPVAGGSTFNVPTRSPAPLEAQILGPYVSAPVVKQILDSLPTSMTEVQLQNLRDILEHEPETRTDIFKLSTHLVQRQQNQGEGNGVEG